MKLRYKLVIVAFVVSVIGSFIWSAGHYYSKYQHEKERADEAVRNAESATAITRNVLQSLQIINTVIEANQDAKNQITLESQRTRKISKWLLRMMIVLHVLCLLPLLTGCGSTRTVYVPIPAVPLPASLTTETPQPVIPDPLTYGASLDLNVSLLSALGQCNIDKAGIRSIEMRRNALLAAGK